MAAIGAITTTLYYIIYPVILLATGLFSVVYVLLIPFVHLGHVILYLLLVPVRILEKFESLYIFLGVAVVIGVIAGLFLYLLDRSVKKVLQLAPSESKQQFRQEGSKLLQDPAKIIHLHQWSRPRPLIEDFSASVYPRSREKAFFMAGPSASNDGDKRSSDLYAEWTSSKDKSVLKDSELLSTTILEEEDDNYDSEDI
ncbi:hypothetical protein VTN77DRAFT_7172 [Rasamsonia byssochlamydoides]|uniref:uncharacterized protein n=1 Tax=Rasamsonia byssochlamydoides TaxID=89139 RepID=UPI003743DEE4